MEFVDVEHAPDLPSKENTNSAVDRLTVDKVLQKWVGEFGRGQFWHFVVVSLAWTIESMHTLVMVFSDKEPEWRCILPGDDAIGAHLVNSTYYNFGACPASASLCDLDPTLWEWVDEASVSTISQFGLVCGQHYKVGLVQSGFFVGCLIGAGVFGNLSDSFLGRKGSLLLACMLTGLSGIATSFSPNFYFYLITRGLAGIAVGGVGLSSFVLATEPVGPAKRGQVGMCAFYFFALGVMFLPAVAYFSESWRRLYMVISVACVLYCGAILPFVSESPRWYLVKGRVEDAMVVLRALARRNGNMVPSGVTLITDEDSEQRRELSSVQEAPDVPNPNIRERPESGSSQAASGTLIDVFILPATRWRMIIMIFIWFACAVAYYGISLNVVNVGFNLYLAVFFNGLVELPAYAITAALLGRVGRRMMVIITMLLSGVSCLLGALFHDPSPMSDPQAFGTPHLSPSDLQSPILSPTASVWPPTASGGIDQRGYNARAVARLLCGVIGIFGMAGTYNLIFIYTCELFPTVVRNAALGLATQAGQIGAITAPMIAGLGHYNTMLPFIAFGIPGVLGGLSAIGLPETLNQPMWETMEELQNGEGRRNTIVPPA